MTEPCPPDGEARAELEFAYALLNDDGSRYPERLILQDLHRRLTELEERSTEAERRELEEILQSGGYGKIDYGPHEK